MSLPERIALWDAPYVGIVRAALERRLPSADQVSLPAEQCAEALANGTVDMALVPTVAVMANADRFDVLPAFALSSWEYPFARIRIAGTMDRLSPSLVVPPDASQEAFIASVVLQEHYGARVLAVPSDETPAGDVNALLVDGGRTDDPATELDLGREWFELTNYPMVWGVLVMRRGEADDQTIRLVSETAALCEQLREQRSGQPSTSSRSELPPQPAVSERGSTSETHAELVERFVADQLRFRLDDLAVASLTELSDFLFFYSGTDEPPGLNVVSLQKGDDDRDDVNGLPAV